MKGQVENQAQNPTVKEDDNQIQSGGQDWDNSADKMALTNAVYAAVENAVKVEGTSWVKK